MKTGKLWGKRFEKEAAPLAEAFTSGRDVRGIRPADEKLIPYDLWGSRAHVVMLARQKIIPRKESRILIKGLREIEESWKEGKFNLDPSKEDVHSNVESWLIAKYGLEAGGRLHTARSRNDQVALDMRLYLRECVIAFVEELLAAVSVLLVQGRKYKDLPIPGYTHHQPAQITVLGHIYFGFAEALIRDCDRLQNWWGRFNQNPLGAMTGYSTSFPVDRELTSKLLGFDQPCQNSIDAIQNRWEGEAEIAFALSTMMNHLSSLAQTLILFATAEFGLIRLDDAYSSGSSMMPQKRNPDPLEVVKAKASVAHGVLVSLLGIGRSLFIGYNRDTQWTKYLVMDLIDECFWAPRVMAEVLASLQVNKEKMKALCNRGYIGAPDLLERIVQEGKMPFRQAKGVVEKAVKNSEREKATQVTWGALEKALEEEKLSYRMEAGIFEQAQQAGIIVSRRLTKGATSRSALQVHALGIQKKVGASRRWAAKKKKQINQAKVRLLAMEKNL